MANNTGIKYGGRQKGTPNKATARLREAFTDLLEDNMGKMVERKVNPKMINAIGGEIIGTEVYNPRQQDLLLFFKGGQLETFITTEGKNNSRSDIKLANTIYVITRDRDSYTLEVKESKTESKTGSGFLKK